MKGRLYHAMNGTWFAPEQRAEIVRTMNELASSKGMESGGTKPSTTGAPTATENWVRGADGKLVKQ